MEILSGLKIHSRVLQELVYTGIDSLEFCENKDWFINYPHKVSYTFNSRGFRDQEWPENLSDLRHSIWCLGDSFTVGLGSPIDHIWCKSLQKKSQQRTINISMDGASNEWMSRWAKQIADQIGPKNIIIMWSFLHRREKKDPCQSDEQRRIWNTYSTVEEDLENLKQCVLSLKHPDSVQHYIIPKANQYENWLNIWKQVAGPDWPEQPLTVDEFKNLPLFVVNEMKKFGVYKKILTATQANEKFKLFCRDQNIYSVETLDLARDGVHFGPRTSEFITDRMINRLS